MTDNVETSENGVEYSTLQRQEHQRDQRPVMTVPVSSLVSCDSPRLAGENIDHARALAESEATFPPIIVNRATMRVVDGMHRLRAAVLRGQNEIEVRFFDGDEEDSFVLAVEANVTHGLPLTLTDRTAAAIRIINSHPQWSDRAIASTVGLSAKTVGAIRRRSTEENPRSNTRTGRDGRVRPLSTTEGRKVASELMIDNPATSLREVARSAGISLGTAKDVRDRLRRGENPVLSRPNDRKQRKGQTKHDEPANQPDNKILRRMPIEDRVLILRGLSQDPSLRFTDTGRILLRLMHVLAIDPMQWEQLIDNVPTHYASRVSAAARACADAWQDFAEQLQQHQA